MHKPPRRPARHARSPLLFAYAAIVQSPRPRWPWRSLAALAFVTLPSYALAAPEGWAPLPASSLDTLRGGFTGVDGLTVSLGIERLVSVNGSLVARTSIELADVGRLHPDQARQAGAALSHVNLIQNGSANVAAPGFSADTLGGTVIQNTLNNQQIESRTVITSTVNSSSVLGIINFSGSLNDSLARAAGPR